MIRLRATSLSHKRGQLQNKESSRYVHVKVFKIVVSIRRKTDDILTFLTSHASLAVK